MRYQDAIERTQALAKLSAVPGLLSSIWGTHYKALEGAVAHGPRLRSTAPGDLHVLKDPRESRAAEMMLAGVFEMAEPFYVASRLVEAIEVAAPALPLATKLRAEDFPSTVGCLFFDRPVRDMPHRRLHPDAGAPMTEPAPFQGFAWRLYKGSVALTFLYDWATDPSVPNFSRGIDYRTVPLSTFPWDFGATSIGSAIDWYDAQLTDEGEPMEENNAARFRISLRLSIATLLLMGQTLTVSSRLPVDRAARRRAEKSGWAHDPSVLVVELRRVTPPTDYRADSTPVEWSHRWWVACHWRTLHRGTRDERTVWIAPYIKGPESKPLATPKQRVWAVVR